jgi:hypothetical protein
MDQMLALRKSPEAYASYYLTPEERLRFLESNVYYALSTAEEYVWCYSEMMNWWQNSFPEGTEAAVRSAQSKVRGNEPLGFDVAEMMDAATEKMNAAISARLVQRTAVLHSLAAGTSPPRIDGVLDDPLWQGLPPLEPFLPTAVSVRDQPECSTTAWVAYDRDMLYIAFRCAESEPANMKLVGKQKDDDVWVGDDVEVFVSASEDPYPYHQFIVNPANVQWDAECSQGQATNPDWSAQWESATHVGQNEWTAEIAIPWEALGGRPDSGSTRRANLCRNRAGALEVTTWCPVGRGFLEAEHFGVWKSAD